MMLKGTFLKATAVIVADDPGHSGDEEEYDYIISQTYNNIALYYLNYSLDYYKASECLLKALEHCSAEGESTFYPLVLANLTLVHYYRRTRPEWNTPGHFRNGQHKTTGFSHSTPEDFKPASAMLSTAAAFAADGSGIPSERIFIFQPHLHRSLAGISDYQ